MVCSIFYGLRIFSTEMLSAEVATFTFLAAQHSPLQALLSGSSHFSRAGIMPADVFQAIPLPRTQYSSRFLLKSVQQFEAREAGGLPHAMLILTCMSLGVSCSSLIWIRTGNLVVQPPLLQEQAFGTSCQTLPSCSCTMLL